MKSQGLVTLVIALLSHTLVLTTSQFTVQPVSVVQAQGLDAVFECRYPGASNYLWKLNGEFLTDDSYPRGVTVSPPSGDTPATLTIPATAQYRNTVVQCVALVRDERVFIPELSVNATLQVQGPLPAVTDLIVINVAGNCSQLSVTWVAPFSLNLTTAEPDIQYCVDVFDVTYEREENLLQSECNITTTQYLFDVPYLVGTSSFFVTPRSNIDGSLNGTISTGQFTHDTRTDTLTPVTDVVDNSTTVIVGGIAAAAAATVVIIAFLVVIVFVWREKRQKKHTVADLDVKPKANSTPPMQHPVVYALIDGSSLASRSVEKNTPCLLPSIPPLPTAESVLAEIYPIAKRWEALGEALGIKEHHLDSFSTEGHEQVCLHDMILHYFTFGPRSWEDIVKALWEIGETEAADKIIRNGKCTVKLPVTSPTETPPPLPPRNDTTMAASHQTEAGELSHDDWQDHSVQESNTESTEEHQGSVLSAGDQVIAVGESDEYN